MTIIEKIKSLTWFDLINKLKSILTDLNPFSESDIDAIKNANNPDGTNTFATLADISDGGSGVQTVTGAIINNTDPSNPVINTPTFEQVLSTGNQSVASTGQHFILRTPDNLAFSNYYSDRVTYNETVQGLYTEVAHYGFFNGSNDGRFAYLTYNSGLSLKTQVGGGVAELKTTNVTGNLEFEFPNSSGTLALLSDLPSISNVKRYVATLNMNGASVPTATVLENSLGTTVLYIRSGIGKFLMYTTTALAGGDQIGEIAKISLKLNGRTVNGTAPFIPTYDVGDDNNGLYIYTFDTSVSPHVKADYTALNILTIDLTVYP